MADTKSILGGVGGAALGFFLGGPIGAFKGFLWGVAAGSFYSALKADVPVPGKPQMNEFQVSTAANGILIADLLGTSKFTGNLFWYGDNRTVENVEEQQAGKGGGGQSVVTGYEYFLTWAMGLCIGPVDELYAVYKDDECVWSGNLLRPESGGEETITLEGMGSMTFFFGTDDQVPPSDLDALLDDDTLSPGYRHQCWAFFNDCSLGGMNRAPIMKFIIRKTPTHDFDSNEIIETYKYNPAHAIYYTLVSMIGLPSEYIDEEITFPEIAERLYYEGLGICTLFDNQNEAQSYLEGIISHFGGILNWKINAKLGLKLIREEINTSRMLSISQDDMIGEMTFTRRAWIDTLNDIKVQFPQLYNEGPDSACVEECDQPIPVIALDSCSPRGRGKYIIVGGCPPFKLYWAQTGGTEWFYVKTIHAQEFIYDCDGYDCSGVARQRTIKIVDDLARDSNQLSFQNDAVSTLLWGGDKIIEDGGSVAIAVVGGKPPYYFTFDSTTEPGFWFDSDYSIKKLETFNDVVTVYHDGHGCPNGVSVHVEDACGQQVTGTITGPGVSLEWVGNPGESDTIPYGGSLEISVTGGKGGYWWATTGQHLWFDPDHTLKTILTTGTEVTLYDDGTQCDGGEAYVSCSDVCSTLVSGFITYLGIDELEFDDDNTPETISAAAAINLYILNGRGPFTWSTVSKGYTLGESETDGHTNTLSVVSGTCGVDYDVIGTVTVTDSCGDSISFDVRNTDGNWTAWTSLFNNTCITTCGFACTATDTHGPTTLQYPACQTEQYRYGYNHARVTTCSEADENDCCAGGAAGMCGGYDQDGHSFMCSIGFAKYVVSCQQWVFAPTQTWLQRYYVDVRYWTC